MARSNARLLAVAGLALSSLAACDAIIGLSDFKKGECSGGGACLDEAGPPIVDGGVGDATPEAGRGAQPVSWARWQMPNYPGADAGADADTSATANNTVTDNVTHLVWQAKGDTNSVDFPTAEAACNAILPAGQWRLPKRIELITLLDFSKQQGLYSSLFQQIPNGPVWSSSEYRTVDAVTTQFWVVSFKDGTLSTAEGSLASAGTLCVEAQ